MKLPGHGELVGQRLGRYQLDELLGAGGMAEVYRAHDVVRRTNRSPAPPVAVKVLPENLAQDEGYVRRFREEVARVRKLGSRSNIVQVLDAGEDHGLLYLVMPLFKESLRDRMSRYGKPPIAVAVRIARQIADALDTAHQRNIVHRDVKPENILLDEHGDAYLTDFGIARDLTPRQGGTLYTLSASGLPVGTPEYMPPEQLLARHIDQRTDIYALGVVLYELLTEQVPFGAENPYQVAAKVVEEDLTPPRELNPAVPAALNDAVVWALQRNPADRYSDMREFDKALEQALRLPPNQRLTMGAPRNFRLTERLAEGGALTLAGGSAAYRASGLTSGRVPTNVTWMDVPEPVKRALMRRAKLAPVQVGLMSGILGLLLLSVCGGGSLFAANRLGLTFPNGDPSSDAPTTIVVAPTATIVPTNTPVILPTATRPAPTPTPVPKLVAGQFTIWAKHGSGGSCRWTAQQEVDNPASGETLGWQWQTVTPTLSSQASFRWGLNTGSSTPNSGMPISPSQAAGAPVILFVSFIPASGCSSPGTSYTVTMVDSQHRTYTFTMQPQQ